VSSFDVSMRKTLRPASEDGFSRSDYCKALAAIASSEHGCVTYGETESLVGESPLREMQKRNRFFARPYHRLAKDIPEEAYKGTKSVVTMPSVAALAFARELLAAKELEDCKEIGSKMQ